MLLQCSWCLRLNHEGVQLGIERAFQKSSALPLHPVPLDDLHQTRKLTVSGVVLEICPLVCGISSSPSKAVLPG